MSDDGAFTHALDIPATLKPGTYGISAAPNSVDWRDDTGHNNRVENPRFGHIWLRVVRAACGLPRGRLALRPQLPTRASWFCACGL